MQADYQESEEHNWREIKCSKDAGPNTMIEKLTVFPLCIDENR